MTCRASNTGEFFSNEAMRARQPLLHLQYVGQYLPAAPAARAPTEGGHPLSSSILQVLPGSPQIHLEHRHRHLKCCL